MAAAVMLDVDGVLVHPGMGGHWSGTLPAAFGLPPDALTDVFFARDWSRIVRGEAAMLPILDRALDEIGAGIGAEAFVRHWFAADARLDADLVAALPRLRRRARVWLATNQEPLRLAHLRDTLGFGSMVDGIVASCDVGATKPDAAFFVAAEARAGGLMGNCLLVDDTPENVTAARATGWRALLWTPASRPDDILTVLDEMGHAA